MLIISIFIVSGDKDSANRAKYQRRTRFSLYLLYLASRTATFGSEMQPIFEHSSKITLFPDIPTKGTSFFISTDLKDIKDFATKVALAPRSLESQESVDLLFPRRFIGLRSQGGKEFFPHRGYNAVFPLPTASHK